MMTRYVLALFLMAFLFSIPNSLAQPAGQPPVGTIAETEGAVTVAARGAAAPGMEIYLGDTLETGAGAKAMIAFIDDTELTLGENARLTIDEYVFDEEDASSNKGRFSILRGAFIFTSGLIGKREKPDVQIETGYGSIGLRGTTVWGGTIDDEYNVFVQDGEVSFATSRGQVIVRKGEGTRVSGIRGVPARAAVWAPEKTERAVKTIALKNPGQAKARIEGMKTRHAALRAEHKKARLNKAPGIENRDALPEKRIDRRLEHRPVRKSSPATEAGNPEKQDAREKTGPVAPRKRIPFGPEKK